MGTAIEEVYKTLIIAFILVVIIIYLFLRKYKSCNCTSSCITCKFNSIFFRTLFIWFINKYFCLLSFILAIGIITDDSVIMTDAIYRRIENGESPLVAAIKDQNKLVLLLLQQH